MFEWRIFKKLPVSKLADFEAMVTTWRKGVKYQIERYVDAYIILPPLFQELNA